MTEQDKLVRLRLRQSQRREIPWVIAKYLFFASILGFLMMLMGNCGVSRPEAPITKAQNDENKQQLYGNQKEAHKARLP